MVKAQKDHSIECDKENPILCQTWTLIDGCPRCTEVREGANPNPGWIARYEHGVLSGVRG